MSGTAYQTDALAWAEQQADLLRRVAAGERLNDAVDWPHVIDEVRDVGLSDLRACRGRLRQALVHLLKLRAWPARLAAGHWRGEGAGFLSDARDRFTSSLRQRLDLNEIYAGALYAVVASADESGAAPPLLRDCPFSLDDLLTARADVAGLLAWVG